MGLYTTTEQGAAPSTPASGSITLYAKTDGIWYWKDDSGNEHALIGNDSTQTLTNKTLTSPTIQGTVGAGTGLTLPALVLSGNVTSTGNPSLNIGSGALTAGIASFTANDISLALLSGNAAVRSRATIGRASADAYYGVAGGTSSLIVGDAVGDFDFVSINKNINWSGDNGNTKHLSLSNAVFTAAIPIITGGYTVGTLPSGTVGMRAYVTDATAPTYNGALTGGGAVKIPVFYNGSAWVSA